MKSDTTKTQVKFLLEPSEGDEQPELFAYFPNEDYTRNGLLKSCYSTVGQHSGCSPEYAENCIEAQPHRYKALKQELEAIGYTNLQILNKWQ